MASQGQGETICILNAYSHPNLFQDVQYFNETFGLPQFNCSGCPQLKLVTPASETPVPEKGWAGEIALDVEWAHAIAPLANITLIMAKDNATNSLMEGVRYATQVQNCKILSMSFGGPYVDGYRDLFEVNGLVAFAATGDDGSDLRRPMFPAVLDNVVAVGGTSLILGTAIKVETGWSGSGGGISRYIKVPSYQAQTSLALSDAILSTPLSQLTGKALSLAQKALTNLSQATLSYRTTPDVSAIADPNYGVAVYDTYGGTGWAVIGGTSLGTPIWAAATALMNSKAKAQNKPVVSNFHEKIYVRASALKDIKAGVNLSVADVPVPVPGVTQAITGYDLVTGLGSLDNLSTLYQAFQNTP